MVLIDGESPLRRGRSQEHPGRVPERHEDSLINIQGKPCLFADTL